MSNLIGSKVMKGYSILKINDTSFRVFSDSLPQGRQSNTPESSIQEQVVENLTIPASAMGSVIGHKGNNIKSIRTKSRANITLETRPIPSDSPAGEEISENIAVILGTPQQVSHALSLLGEFINKNDSHTPTHFLSIPLVAKSFISKVQQIQAQLGLAQELQLKKACFSSPSSIHLTLGILSLKSEASINNANRLLSSLQPSLYKITQGEQISLNMQGLGYFPKETPEKARVLFAKVQTLKNGTKPDVLKQLTDCVRNKFNQAGLLMEAEREPELHATLYKVRPQDKNKIAIKPILEKLGEFSFGTCPITEVQLCKMGQFETEGSYVSVGSVSLK
ncbi:hypothetical protein DSO57_1030836 [Entomophthora muscae]|uniref:Uncharacterized protein n=1 Tax=Entomophthora muscae TaxID=34485 RepID=A0ACC2UAB1_9FUNG|nr:hypothetical protein DSO57_1030836 [Entomophthora muscae]